MGNFDMKEYLHRVRWLLCGGLPAAHPAGEIDCDGTSPCSTCPNKRECGKAACIRIAQRRRAMRGDAGSAGNAGVPGVSPSDKITIRYERAGHCFWHVGCTAQRHAPPMRVGTDDGARTLIHCTACGESGYYPHGGIGDVSCERGPAGNAGVAATAKTADGGM